MSDRILSFLLERDIVKNARFNTRKISRLSTTKLLDLCEEFSAITSYEHFKPVSSIFTHSASLGLSGSRHPCSGFECREKKIKQLSQFSALYSDKVYIDNFLYDHTIHEEHDHDKLYFEIIEDMRLLVGLLPLIEHGRVQPVTYANICNKCLIGNTKFNIKYDGIDEAVEYIRGMFVENVKYYIEKDDIFILIIAEGPEHLLPHGNSVWMYEEPFVNCEAWVLSIAEHLVDGERYELTQSQVIEHKVNEMFSEGVIQSIFFELGNSNKLRSSFLSDSTLEIDLIKKISTDPILRKRSLLLEKHLTCIVPFLEDVRTEDLLKLRENEDGHFIVFRQSLNKALDELLKSNTELTEADARAIYSDTIEPNLAKIELEINKAKRHFQKDSRRKVLGWVGALSAGSLAGIYTANFWTASAAIGIVKAGADFLTNTMEKSDVEEGARNHDMYFLWRVKQLSENKK